MKEYFPNYKPDGLDAYAGGPDVQLCVYGPRHLGTGFDYSRVVYPPTFYAIGRIVIVGYTKLTVNVSLPMLIKLAGRIRRPLY